MEAPAEFAVTVDASQADRVVVRVTGELDMSTSDALEKALASVERVAHVVIDLSDCTFVDSAGVRATTSTIRATERVSLVTADPGILRLFEITAVDTMAGVHATLEDAVSPLSE